MTTNHSSPSEVMADIPMVLITEILARLPVKSLVRFCCVSKTWESLIKDPDFAKLHLQKSLLNKTNQALILRDCYIYSAEFPALNQATVIYHPLKSDSYGTEVLGSCNGLLCLSNGEEEGIDGTIFYNPATRKHLPLPASSIEFPDYFTSAERMIYGFGYDHDNDDYKLVRVIQFYGQDADIYDSEVKVFSLKSSSWRRIKDFPRELYLSYKRAWGVCVNGCLHWVVTRKYATEGSKLIVSFNLGSEKYKIVPQPRNLKGEFHMNVEALNGCLCLLCNYPNDRSEVWMMKEYGVEDSWTRLFSIEQGGKMGSFEYVRPITYSNDGSSVLLDKDCKHLIWFNIEKQTVKKAKIRDMPSSFDASMLVESLVPLEWHEERKEEKPNKRETRSKKKRDDLDGFLSKGFRLKL